jgi:hypothetical protein
MQGCSPRLPFSNELPARHPQGRPVHSRLSTSLTLAAMSLGYGVVQLGVTIEAAVHCRIRYLHGSIGGLQVRL